MTPPATPLVRILIPVVAAAGLLWGWRELLFLTDDAFISFRYARNLLQGWGLVWNPAPFPPVEGYTSLLWVLLLAGVWAVTGVPPDVSANLLSLLCGAGSLLLTADLLRRTPLPPDLQPHRTLLLGIVLLGILSNRTFLTWLSSGLETALFNLLVLWWVREALASPRHNARLALAVTLLALTRPDGVLYAALSLPLLWKTPLQATPLLLLPAHALWRWQTYGAWLPNTYAAKVSTPWPAAGWRYLASFALENGVWVWLLLPPLLLLSFARQRPRSPLPPLPILLVVAALGGQVAYYTLQVGGDHFEYRILSHLIPPLFLSAVWMAARLAPARPLAVMAILLAFTLASWPIAWTHHALSQSRWTLSETQDLTVPLAPHFPAPLRPLIATWDGWQAWLISHFVCKRRQEHQAFLAEMVRLFPTPDPAISPGPPWEAARALWWSRSVGYAGWALPQVAIIDALGLNDPVVAHGPTRESLGLPRRMAHDRQPPEGFLDCFRYNLQVVNQIPQPLPQVPPMTDPEIHACYERFSPARTNTGGS